MRRALSCVRSLHYISHPTRLDLIPTRLNLIPLSYLTHLFSNLVEDLQAVGSAEPTRGRILLKKAHLCIIITVFVNRMLTSLSFCIAFVLLSFVVTTIIACNENIRTAGFKLYVISKLTTHGGYICIYYDCTEPKIWFMNSQKWNCSALFPIPTFMYLWAIYIFPGSVSLFGCNKIGRQFLGIYESLTDTWMLKLGDRTL